MSLFSSFDISGSGLTAEKLRLDLIAGNLANVNTTRTPDGGPYQRRTAVFAEHLEEARRSMPGGGPPVQGRGSARGAEDQVGSGVQVASIYADPREPRQEYNPEHPDADEEGYVEYPNIEVSKEITDLITAQRSYESSATALNTAKDMYQRALEIGM